MIAIASSDGKKVDLHFGHAGGFYIFKKEDDTLVFEKRVAVTPLSIGDKNHPFDEQKFSGITDALKGCSLLYCTKIGEKPLQEMQKSGIEVTLFAGSIDDIT